MEAKNIKLFNQGDMIFEAGAYESWMYDICKGSVGIYAGYGSAEEKLLVELKAGQHFGEIGLIGCYPRSATAVALEDGVELAVVAMDQLGVYFRNRPDMLLSIMRTLSKRTRLLTQDYMDVCRTIAEAAEAAKKGEAKSSGLKAKIAKFVSDYIKPCFMSPSVDFDIDSYMLDSTKANGGTSKYGRNELIFRQGDAASCMYDIRQGSVGIYVDYGKASQKLLTELGEDSFFGEMGMIDSEPRSATAVSHDDNTVLKMITAADFPAFIEERPAKVLMLVQQMCTRLRDLTQDYMDACRNVAEATKAEEADASIWMAGALNKYIDDYYRIGDSGNSLFM